MKIPILSGIIRRRILLNYRVSPDVAATHLPSNFRPKLIRDHAIAGICLIRLEQVRPKGLPAFIGISSENAAHRFAVEWTNADGSTSEGVFVPRRDTDSTLNSLAGGRIFPGVHHHSTFTVNDQAPHLSIHVQSSDSRHPLIEIEAQETQTFPTDSIFNSLQESSAFFENGCIGYSSRPDGCILDGLQLKIDSWQVSPLAIIKATSTYFDNPALFPPNSIHFDHALIMRGLPHEWHSQPSMNG